MVVHPITVFPQTSNYFPPMSSAKNASAIATSLLAWYNKNARTLPWRIGPRECRAGEQPDPYRVWMSEIMLQQTTVATVKTRFAEFTNRWPTVHALAQAPVQDVLGAWAGLGYYARARNLHKCAVTIVEDHGGEFPSDEEKLRTLPGIGDYTAAAIAAIAFDQHAVVMDGNIERIVARLFEVKTPLPKAKAALKTHTGAIWPTKRHGDFAQGLMDVGATICRPKKPLCLLCPLNSHCAAHGTGTAEGYPVKAPKKKKPERTGAVWYIQHKDGRVALEVRPDKGLLGGMLGLPGSEWKEGKSAPLTPPIGTLNDWQAMGNIRHTFTHFHLSLDVYKHTAKRLPDHSRPLSWHDANTDDVPTVMKKALQLVLDKSA